MKTLSSKKLQIHSVARSDFFVAKPERMMEWLGGVNYENLQKILSEMKGLMLSEPKEELQLLVNSFGGATGIGMSFYDAVTTWLKPNLCTIGSGDVDSSGIIVFLAGKRRFLTPNTTMLFHLAGRTLGNDQRFSTADMGSMLKEDKLKDYQYAGVVSERTSGQYSREAVLELMAGNTIVTAEEAVAMGLADQVLI